MFAEYAKKAEMGECLQFESAFESGNLDRVVMVGPNEYDLYMRADTNVRGHHQWFYFKTTSRKKMGTVKFNILNFTKRRSLYESGMRVCILNVADRNKLIEQAELAGKPYDRDIIGWYRGGENIKYQPSKVNRIIEKTQMLEQGPDGGYTFYRGPYF